MTAMAEGRRNDARLEIERHRTTFSDALRRNVQQIEEVECQVVDAVSVEECDRHDQQDQDPGEPREREGQ
jgi:hypothetical protein